MKRPFQLDESGCFASILTDCCPTSARTRDSRTMGSVKAAETFETTFRRRFAPSPKNRRRKHSVIAFEMVSLDRASREPLHEQLYRQIRNELESGAFNSGSWRLPSSRTLSTDLGV